jgi:5-methylcytosine-specific restriction endonuclease McrA
VAVKSCLGCGTITTGTYCTRCRYRVRRRISSGSAWAAIRAAVHARDRVCTRCGAGSRLEVHHRVALIDGGGNELDNLELLCHRCHVADS